MSIIKICIVSLKQFGGKVTKQLEERYAKSPNWKEGKFQNLIETKMDISIWNMPKLMYKQIFETNGREPESPIPIVPFDKVAFFSPTKNVIKCFHHETFLCYR